VTSTLVYGGLGLAALIVGAAAFMLLALPAGIVRDRVIAAVKEKTGRDLVIAGSPSFAFFPAFAVTLPDVSLSAAPGFQGDRPFAAARAIDVSVDLMPLLRREVRVRTLVVRDPVFNLDVDSSGRKSWEFAVRDEASRRVRLAQADTSTSVATDAPPALPAGRADAPDAPNTEIEIAGLSLDDVRIANGTLNYRDALSGRTDKVEAIDVAFALPGVSEALSTRGTAVWKGETVSIDSTLASPADLRQRRPAKFALKLSADSLATSFDGTLSLDRGFLAEGILDAKSPSVRALVRWLGTELPPSEGYGAMTAKGLLRGTPDKVSFETAEIVLDRTTAHGDVSLDLAPALARPHVTANLKLTELDLNTYRSTGERSSSPPSETPASPGSSGASSIEDILGRGEGNAPPGPRVKGYAHREGWSDAPFDLGALGALDADAKLSISRLGLRTIRLDQTDVTLALKDRVIETTLDDVRLYDGNARGTVTLDGSDPASATVNTNVTFDGVAADRLLHDAAGFDHLAGKGRLAVVMWGRGANEREVVESLNGRVEFSVADGAVIGIDIPALTQKLKKGNFGGLAVQPTDKTAFNELTSTWTVKQGIAENQDLKVTSELVHVSGSGRIAIPAREIDYTLRPRLASASQDPAQAGLGLEIPVHMYGPWDDPKFKADLGGALKNDKAKEALKDIKKQLKGKKTDEIVNDLLTKGDSETSDGEGLKAKGKKLLDQFLNKD